MLTSRYSSDSSAVFSDASGTESANTSDNEWDSCPIIDEPCCQDGSPALLPLPVIHLNAGNNVSGPKDETRDNQASIFPIAEPVSPLVEGSFAGASEAELSNTAPISLTTSELVSNAETAKQEADPTF